MKNVLSHIFACTIGFGLGIAMTVRYFDRKYGAMPEPFDADDFGDEMDDEMDDDDEGSFIPFCTDSSLCED